MAEPNRTRFTIRGDRINSLGEVIIPQGRNTSGQDALHHCHLHKKRALHDNVHLHLLPHDTFAPTKFHPNEIERHSGRSHQRI